MWTSSTRRRRRSWCIDRNSEAKRAIRAASSDAIVITDNATDDRVLLLAGVERAKGLATCLDVAPAVAPALEKAGLSRDIASGTGYIDAL